MAATFHPTWGFSGVETGAVGWPQQRPSRDRLPCYRINSMSDERILTDISQYIADYMNSEQPTKEPADDCFTTPTSFTLSGVWGGTLCQICGSVFVAGPEGVPSVVHEATGASAEACPTCVMKLTAGNSSAS